jgi:glycosyltransferase involved in cell wall biosynthesis
MKILFIIDSLSNGGKERRLLELLKGLNGLEGFETELILLTDLVEFNEIYDLKIRIHKIRRIINKDPSVFFKINRICKDFQPDVINSWGLMPAVYGAPVAKYRKIKFVNSMIVNAPEKLDFKTRFYSKFVFPLSDVITANSYAGLNSYGISHQRSKVIYNGFDFSRIKINQDAASIRLKWGIKSKYLAGMVAGFRMHKDYATLITAAKYIINSGLDVSFILVGDGPTLEESKKSAEGYQNIIFTGRQTGVEEIINACDIGILSTYTEGISNSIMEFMAMGKPVVATEGGGTKEIIEDGATGFLIPQKSPELLQEKIKALFEDEKLRLLLGKNSYEKIKMQFGIGKMVKDFIDLYEKLIK